MEVSPCGANRANTYGFMVEEQPYRPGQATAHTPTDPAISGDFMCVRVVGGALSPGTLLEALNSRRYT